MTTMAAHARVYKETDKSSPQGFPSSPKFVPRNRDKSKNEVEHEIEVSEILKNVMDRALKNPLVVQKILEKLDLHQLLPSRIVNNTWHLISSQVIQKRDCCKVNILYDPEKKLYYRKKYYTTLFTPLTRSSASLASKLGLDFRIDPLDVLNDLLENSVISSTPFPCTDFCLQCGHLGDDAPSRLFRLHGVHIKSLHVINLSLQMDSGRDKDLDTYPAVFHDLLTNGVPHLKYLTLKMNSDDLPSFQSFDHADFHHFDLNFVLPSLKIFSWQGQLSHNIILAILKGSPNLRIIKDLPAGFDLDLVVSAGRTGAVKELSCGRLLPFGLKKFLSDNPVLESLAFELSTNLSLDFNLYFINIEDQTWPELIDLILGLLRRNRCTLKSLDLETLFYVSKFKNHDLPIFPALTRLSMGSLSVEPQACFPPGIDLTQTFPVLKVLNCTNLQCDKMDNWDKHFAHIQGDLPLVQTLEISDSCTKLWIQNLNGLCPNFKKVNIHTEGTEVLIKMIMRIFCLWAHLTSIEIVIQITPPFPRRPLRLNFDSVITGLADNICDQLRTNETEGNFPYDNLQKNTTASISKMKYLKNFFIWFRTPFDPKCLPLTRVAFVHGFQRVHQNLRITLQFDHNAYSHHELQKIYGSLETQPINIRHKLCPHRPKTIDVTAAEGHSPCISMNAGRVIPKKTCDQLVEFVMGATFMTIFVAIISFYFAQGWGPMV